MTKYEIRTTRYEIQKGRAQGPPLLRALDFYSRYDTLVEVILFNINKEVLEMAEGYCVKCKAKKEMKDAKEVTMKNGRKAMKGSCPDCGTGMYRIMGK